MASSSGQTAGSVQQLPGLATASQAAGRGHEELGEEGKTLDLCCEQMG